jgi:hypothetical protein
MYKAGEIQMEMAGKATSSSKSSGTGVTKLGDASQFGDADW